MITKILVALLFLGSSVGVFACHLMAKAVHTNPVTQLVTANHKVYVQRVGGAMINPHKVHHQVWLFSNK